MTGSSDALLPLEFYIRSRLKELFLGPYMTAFTTSLMTSPLAISIFSTPEWPSARDGPTLRSSTGFCSSTACFSNLQYSKIRCSKNQEYGRYLPESRICCKGCADNKKPVTKLNVAHTESTKNCYRKLIHMWEYSRLLFDVLTY